jgi:DNA polymerase-4
MRLSDMVGRRLRAADRRGNVVSIGVVYRPDVARFTKQSKLAHPIATGDEIYQAALKLMASRDPRLLVGTLGVGLAGLSDTDPGQMDLFAEASSPRGARIEKAIDAIRDRFGEDAVQRARLLGRAAVVRDRIAFGNTGHPDEKPRTE